MMDEHVFYRATRNVSTIRQRAHGQVVSAPAAVPLVLQIALDITCILDNAVRF
jgi:hypothetical protein